jgi:hypothetical protein
MKKVSWGVFKGAARWSAPAPLVLALGGTGCGPADAAPTTSADEVNGDAFAEPTEIGSISSALAGGPMRTPLRPFKVRDLGTVPMGEHVTARDGTSCLKFQDRTLFIFGDTVLDPPGMPNNSMLTTTDTNFWDGIDPALSQNFRDSAHRPLQWIPKTPEEITFENGEGGMPVILWPGQMFKVGTRSYATFSKFYKFGPNPYDLQGIGTGLAQVVGYDVVASRTAINDGLPRDPRGQLEPDLVLRSDEGQWDAALTVSKDKTYLYMFQSILESDGAFAGFYVARARTANEEFKQPANWRVLTCAPQTGSATPACAGATSWSSFTSISSTNIKAPIISSTNGTGAIPVQASVEWNEYYQAYLLTYLEWNYGTCWFGTQWCPSRRMMMRLASDVTGQWSEPVQVDTLSDVDEHGNSPFAYVAKAQGCLAEHSGRVQYLSYAISGEVTGGVIRLKQLRFAGARGDFAGSTRSDIALVGGAGWTTIPVASSNGDGTFNVTNSAVSSFPGLATQTGAIPVSGDFNGDGVGDIALTGGFKSSGVPWTTVPVAFARGDGTFNVTNTTVSSFPTLATQRAKPVGGDFNGDGRDDIALIGGLQSSGTPWTKIPVAFSNGNGAFNVTNLAFPSALSQYVTQSTVEPTPGDYDGDGKDDIAFLGLSGFDVVPVARSKGNGTFDVVISNANAFQGWSTQPGVKPVAGDFNGDGLSDFALVGMESIPVAISIGNGWFWPVSGPAGNFPSWARVSGAKPVSGDFNGDGKSDIALTGASGRTTIPVAFSGGDGAFFPTDGSAGNFQSLAAVSGAKPVGAYEPGYSR